MSNEHVYCPFPIDHYIEVRIVDPMHSLVPLLQDVFWIFPGKRGTKQCSLMLENC